ncbi:putative flippase GtrA [Arthrobacter sp. GAS37]|uniref:GtrA family protein n=1 Tax=Arthrobacter sp. GAS37 TaxID=3156261 RepID=UPI0038340E5B
MALDPRAQVTRLVGFIHRSHLLKFLIVGGLSFAIDLGLLVLLHEGLGVDLWFATPAAFLSSLVFNYFVQRSYTFQSNNRQHVSMFSYGLLVVFNVLATDVIVNVFDTLALTYASGKVVSAVSTMTWNFFLYKYWIFRSDAPTPGKDQQDDPEFSPTTADG